MNNGNILQPVFDAVWEAGKVSLKALPFLWDKWGNLCYWLVEGVSYGTVIVNEGDEIQTDNIRKYEYIPVEQMLKIEKDLSVVKYTFVEGEKEGVCACIGYNLEGDIKVFDILEGHTMVGGASRWGKSSFLNVFITNIIMTYTPKEIVLAGCDFKRSDIYYFRKYKHFSGGVSTNKQEFKMQINNLEKEMLKRSEILEKANCRNAIKYNKVSEIKLPYIVFIVDELIQLTMDSECSELLHSIMSKCASYGIYFILASQDFTKNTVGRCKMNCSQTVGFHTLDQTDSETLIGKGYNLQDITVKGRCKIKNSDGVEEVQIFYIEEEQIESLLKPFEKETNTNI